MNQGESSITFSTSSALCWQLPSLEPVHASICVSLPWNGVCLSPGHLKRLKSKTKSSRALPGIEILRAYAFNPFGAIKMCDTPRTLRQFPEKTASPSLWGFPFLHSRLLWLLPPHDLMSPKMCPNIERESQLKCSLYKTWKKGWDSSTSKCDIEISDKIYSNGVSLQARCRGASPWLTSSGSALAVWAFAQALADPRSTPPNHPIRELYCLVWKGLLRAGLFEIFLDISYWFELESSSWVACWCLWKFQAFQSWWLNVLVCVGVLRPTAWIWIQWQQLCIIMEVTHELHIPPVNPCLSVSVIQIYQVCGSHPKNARSCTWHGATVKLRVRSLQLEMFHWKSPFTSNFNGNSEVWSLAFWQSGEMPKNANPASLGGFMQRRVQVRVLWRCNRGQCSKKTELAAAGRYYDSCRFGCMLHYIYARAQSYCLQNERPKQRA